MYLYFRTLVEQLKLEEQYLQALYIHALDIPQIWISIMISEAKIKNLKAKISVLCAAL